MAVFTMTASRRFGNPCTADYIVGVNFDVTFGGDTGDGNTIHWAVYSDECATEINSGIHFDGQPLSFPMHSDSPGQLFYSGFLNDRFGNRIYDSPCTPLCYVEDRTDPTITITTSTPEILVHETPDVTVHIDGDGTPSGGGINADWAPSNPRIDCDDPVTYATEWGVTASVIPDPSIGRQLDECGIWAFSFNYSGDTCNKPANSGCVDLVEVFCELPATPTLTTFAVPTGAVVGETLIDTAELLHAYRPTGTITFELYGPDDDDCTSPIYAEDVDVDGNGTYAVGTGYVAGAAGTYHWKATYSGDDNNDGVETDCGDEPVEVTEGTSSVTTTPSADTSPVDTEASDTATLTSSGGPSLTGTITFALYGPDDMDCSGDAIFTEDVDVDGEGDYAPASPPSPHMPGNYQWVVTYSGDAYHAGSASNCGEEQIAVTDVGHVYTPTITTQVSSAEVSNGVPLIDTAHITGGNFPTGDLFFTLYGPNDTDCSNDPVFTTSVSVDHNNGFYPSPSYIPSTPGRYRWVIYYGGDTLNNPVSVGCNDPNEDVQVGTEGVVVSGWVIG